MTPAERTAIVARRLREARELAGLTRGQAAKQLIPVELRELIAAGVLSGADAAGIEGSPVELLDVLEAGRRSPSLRFAAQLAELYAVNFAWLVGEGPDMLDPAKLHAAAAYQLGKLSPADREKMLRSWAAIFGPAGPRFEPQIPQKESTS